MSVLAIHERLKNAREAAGLTSLQLLKRAGDRRIRIGTYHKYESGDKTPGESVLNKLLNACENGEATGKGSIYATSVSALKPNKKRGKVRRGPDIDDIQFIRTWQASETREEVCNSLGIGDSTVCYRRNFMAKNGVPLKAIPKRLGSTKRNRDWEMLIRVAKEAAKA